MNEPNADISIRNYAEVLGKHRWAILTTLAACIALAVLVIFTTEPVYRAMTRILIEDATTRVAGVNDIYAAPADRQEFYQTQYSILSSRAIARRTMDALNLWVWAELNPNPEAPMTPEVEESLIDAFLRKLAVTPVRNTRLVEIAFDSHDRLRSADVANAVVSSYVHYLRETQVEMTHGTSDVLSESIDQQRSKLEESERLLRQYRERNNIISLDEEEQIVMKKLADLNAEILRVRTLRIEAEASYEQAMTALQSSDGALSLPEVLGSDIIKRLKVDEASVTKELSEVSQRLGVKHPRIIALNNKLKAVQDQIMYEARQIVASMHNVYEVALARERLLAEALQALRAESQGLNAHAVAYGVIMRDVEINRQIYQLLLTRLKEAGIAGGFSKTTVRVLDIAVAPVSPIKPRKVFILTIAILLGAATGVGLAFGLEQLDLSIMNSEDIERYLGVPYLGPVPEYTAELKKIMQDRGRQLVSVSSAQSAAAEAYRSLRTAIIFSSSHGNHRSILVTSSQPSEGKSMTASNLAVTLAQSGARTLLIDLDFRRPNIHNIFGLTREVGLSNHLVGESEFADVVQPSGINGLDVVLCGHIPPNPAELLGSAAMKEFASRVREMYDWVVYDTPPVLSATDPVLVSTLVDQVALVVRSGMTSRDQVQRAMQMLGHVKANLIGVILNDVSTGSKRYYHYRYDRKD